MDGMALKPEWSDGVYYMSEGVVAYSKDDDKNMHIFDPNDGPYFVSNHPNKRSVT